MILYSALYLIIGVLIAIMTVLVIALTPSGEEVDPARTIMVMFAWPLFLVLALPLALYDEARRER